MPEIVKERARRYVTNQKQKNELIKWLGISFAEQLQPDNPFGINVLTTKYTPDAIEPSVHYMFFDKKGHEQTTTYHDLYERSYQAELAYDHKYHVDI